MLNKGGVNSRPDSHGLLDGARTDGPGFSLCATPCELSGPGFQDGRVDGMNERGPAYAEPEMVEGTTARGGVKADSINGT